MLLGDWMKGGYTSERAFIEAFNAPPKQTGTQRSVGGSFAKPNKEASGATVIEIDHDDDNDENENEDVVMGGDGNEQQMEMDVDV
jgi:hypothetical protein